MMHVQLSHSVPSAQACMLLRDLFPFEAGYMTGHDRFAARTEHQPFVHECTRNEVHLQNNAFQEHGTFSENKISV